MAGNEGFVRSGPSWAERWGAIVGDETPPSLGSSSSSRLRTLRSHGRSVSQSGHGVARSVQEDLEDYFNRLDGISRNQNASAQNASEIPLELPTVERFGLDDLAKLRRVRYASSGGSSSNLRSKTKLSKRLDSATPSHGSECHICLAAFRNGDALLELPCDGRHRFHEKCIRQWLSKSVSCPLCRVDVKALLPKSDNASTVPRYASSTKHGHLAPLSRGVRRPSLPQAQTAMGGFVVMHERSPPQSWERPSYIPAHLRHLAQYLEVNYPGRGVAKIWRVPNGASGDLSHALPV